MPRQSDLRFTFSVAASQGERPISLDVIEFKLIESLSAPYLLTLELSSPKADIDFARILEHRATLIIWRGEQPVRYVHGIVSSFSQKDSTLRRSHYAATVEPPLARADLRSDWRIYQLQTVPTTLAQTVARSGELDIDTHYRREHATVEYCVQPGETDLHFFNRLCAEYGIYYAFRFDAQGARLALSDCLYEHGVIKGRPVVYNATPGGDQDVPCLTSFQYTESVRTARQVQTNYDYRNPRYNHRTTHIGRYLDYQAHDYQTYHYPGRYVDDNAFGKAKTQARLLALRGDAQIASITGDDARLVPGLAFELEGHRRESLCRWWRVLRLTHTGTQTTSQEEDSADASVGTQYHYQGEVIPDDVEWRAPQLPRPLIDGPQIATVVGPPGEEIFCNDQGMVRLQFAWDLYGNNNEYSSCWVRVGQGWAGAGYGILAIPRVGQEVLVAFESGDADTPIIISRLPNSVQPTPYELPRHMTRTVIKTQTVKGRGSNEIRFEDLANQEEIYVHAQKDQNIVVENDESTRIGHDRQENVANDESIAIGHNRTENVTNDEQVTIGHDRKHTVGQDNTLDVARNHHAIVGKDRIEDVGNQRIDKTGGDYITSTGGNVQHTVQGQVQLQAGEDIVHTAKRVVFNVQEYLVNTPGGVLRIDAHGAYFLGKALKGEAGVIDFVDGYGGVPVTVDGTPNSSLPIDLTDLFLSR